MNRRVWIVVVLVALASLFSATNIAYANVTHKKTIEIGEEIDLEHYQREERKYETYYTWTIESGDDVIEITSDTDERACTIVGVAEGDAVLKCERVFYPVYKKKGKKNTQYEKITVLGSAYEVTYDSNGGAFWGTVYKPFIEDGRLKDGKLTQTVKRGDKYPNYIPGRHGHTFKGWWTKPTGGKKIKDGTIAYLTKNETLYAHWVENAPDDDDNDNPNNNDDDDAVDDVTPNDPLKRDPYHWCPRCNNSGNCTKCGGRKDFNCDATNCLNGRCTKCSGTGYIKKEKKTGTELVDCAYCDNGHCRKCDGKGRIDCPSCGGTGVCSVCNGKWRGYPS